MVYAYRSHMYQWWIQGIALKPPLKIYAHHIYLPSGQVGDTVLVADSGQMVAEC